MVWIGHVWRPLITPNVEITFSMTVARVGWMLLLLPTPSDTMRVYLSAQRQLRALARPVRSDPRAAIVLRFEDDPWLTSTERQPLSGTSLDVLFRYGPVVYGNRCLDGEEYNASVRQFMQRYPKISRALAEQEINEFLADSTGYMARTTAKGYKGPQENDLKPPVGIVDKLLVVAWVAILVPAINFIVQLSLAAPPVTRGDVFDTF